MRALIGSMVALGALGGVAVAEPDPELGLVWHAPAACPSADGIRARIEQRLGAAQAELVHGIVVDIAREQDGFVARVDLRGVTVANDLRTLSAPRCDDLTDAIAVIVARVASEAFAPPGFVAMTTSGAPGSRRDSLALEVTAGRRRLPRAWGGGGRAMAVSGIGGVPAVGLGGELAGFASYQAAFVELAWSRWADGTVMLQPGGAGRVAVGLQAAALRVGWAPKRRPIRAWIGGEVGAMRGEGIALGDPPVGSGRWTAASVGFGVAWPMSSWSRLVGTVELVVPFERARFALDDGHEVYRPGSVSSRAALGLELGWR